MGLSNTRFLFFMEREFHIAMLKPLMDYIFSHNLGEIGIYAPFINYFPDSLRHLVVKEPQDWAPDITFLCDFSYQYVEGLGKLVNIGHGTICKGWFYNRNKISQRENCADLICVPGTVHKERLEGQVYKPIVVTGMPKLDKCFNKSLKFHDLMHKFKLDPEQKTVLLAPTFNEEFSIVPYLKEADLSKVFPNFTNIIVKLHGVGDPSIKMQFEALKAINKNVYIAETYDTDELFFVADLLISDVSSVIYEFLSLEKPILIFDSPKQKQYINFNESDLEWEFRNVGIRFSDIERLPQLIFKVFTSNKDFHFQNISQKFISVVDGTSSEKVVQSAVTLLEQNVPSELEILTNYVTDQMTIRLSNYFRITQIQGKVFDALVQHAKSTDKQYILYIDGSFEFSQQMANFMLNHLKNTYNAKLVVPLVDSDELSLQHFGARVKLQQELNFVQKGIQLGYSFTGQSIEIDYFLPHCFIIKKETLLECNFTNLTDDKLCTIELIAHLLKQQQKVLLAYDCLIKPGDIKHDILEEKPPISGSEMEDLKMQILNDPCNEELIIDYIKYAYNNSIWDDVDIYADMLPNNHEAKYYQIKSYECQGLTTEALDKINDLDLETIDDHRLLVSFLCLKAKFLIIFETFDDILNILEKALVFDSDHVEVLMTRGVFYISQGMTDSAISDFDHLLNLDPNNKKAMRGKAMAMQMDGNYVGSSECYLSILNHDPQDMESINGLLKNSYMINDYKDIIIALNHYLELNHDNTNILFTLAGVYYQNKDYFLAEQILNKLLDIDQDFPGAKTMLTKLESSNY